MAARRKKTEPEAAVRPNYRDLARSMLNHVAKEHPSLGPLDFRLILSALSHARAEGRYWADITRKEG